MTLEEIDRRLVADLYLSRAGLTFLEELVERFGSRFGGTEAERAAGGFIRERLRQVGVDGVELETFTCQGWTRRETHLRVTAPAARELDCIALPFCPPGEVEAPLVYLRDGDPQTYADEGERLRGAIVMVSTATPRFFHRSMHRGEKLGRALEAGAAGFIWMRGEPGGLPETGSARFGEACEVPAISVSYETGHELIRLQRQGGVRLQIASTNENHPVTSHNVVAELGGERQAGEVVLVGAHYDGHDVSQAAADNGAGAAVLVEVARALAPHAEHLDRTVRLVAFAQEEMGLLGAEHHARTHAGGENGRIAFMLNLDGAGRGGDGVLQLQGWPEGTGFFRGLLEEMLDADVRVGDRISLYSDMYPFAARGIPAAHYSSQHEHSSAAPRGFGHTFWDSLDKVSARGLQADAIRIARLVARLARVDSIPLRRKRPAEIAEPLRARGLDEVLRYERRPLPGG